MKHNIGVHIEKNAFIDNGEGMVSFPNGLVITDDTVQKNGTRYDIPSMVLDEYKGQITADHIDMLQAVIGKAINTSKRGTKVVIDAIKFAVKENALAKLAYDLLTADERYITDVSIETYGPPPDEQGVYYGARLVGLSVVVVGNNNSASTINKFIANSIEQAKQEGLDTAELEKIYKINSKETKMSEVENKDKKPKASKDKVVENKATKSEEPKAFDMEAAINSLVERVEATVKPLTEKVEALESNAFDKAAKEPEFTKADNQAKSAQTSKNRLEGLGWEDRTAEQIEFARQMLKGSNYEAAKKLNEINEFHLEGLKGENLVKNAMTIADFGNFVISPELLSEIQGCRNDYSALLNETSWRETLSTQMAWLNRNGDIDMTSVEFCDDDANGNLKPVKEYSATIRTADLEELAAVTPVCNAATRFLAADMLGDIAQGYRTDYDRKRAQLIIARLEQAVEANGNSVIYDTNPAVDALTSFISVWTEIATCTPNGIFVMNTSSYGEVMRKAITAGVSGPLATIFTSGSIPTILGKRFVVVPDDLMPTLDTAGTKTFAVDGTTVTVNHAVYYFNPTNFTGRTSGGLQYDLSTDAAYEVSGTVKSAYQRNEVVLRGSFFRGGAVLDNNQVSGLLSPGVS